VIKANQRIIIENCNDQVTPGIYDIGENTLNQPFRYGYVVALPHTGNNDQLKISFNVSASGHGAGVLFGTGSWQYFDRV